MGETREYPNYDVAIVGGGVCGAAAAYELAKYELKICLIEKEPDLATGTTKANSGIVHAGYDAPTGSLMARYNVAGCALLPALAEKLSIAYKQCGSLVIAFDDEQMATLKTLYERGVANGVPRLRLLDAAGVAAMEPHLKADVKGALYAPTAGIVSPWDLCLAMAETAVRNGCTVLRGQAVTALQNDADKGVWRVSLDGKEALRARYVINAAGLYADRIAAMAGDRPFTIRPAKGQYFLLDRSQGEVVSHVVFQCPTKAGKGVLISPTVTGNLLVGPDAKPQPSREDLSTDREGLDFVRRAAGLDTDAVNYRENIRNFAGLRAYTDRDDFIIGFSPTVPHFFNIAGMKSPGLTSAAAIGADLPQLFAEAGEALVKKKKYIDRREKIRFASLDGEQRAALIAKNPAYGAIVCRCNTVTEGEILDALHSPIPPRTVDGVKRRCTAGMGRCQGGFCSPVVHRLISRELGIPMEDVYLEKEGSAIVFGPTKEAAK